MCGIIGIVAYDGILSEPIGKVLRRCLERLEYRGYDSAGIAVIQNGKLIIRKGKGKIVELSKKLGFDNIHGLVGLGHTRWATHGKPSDENAHPHTDCSKSIAVVHNGIISNFTELREKLEKKGHVFSSETDTEVIPHLVEEFSKSGKSIFEAFKNMLYEIEGTYAIGLISIKESNRIYFARNTSPLIIGIGNGMMMLASDIPAILEFTNRVIVVKDGEYGYVTPNEVYVEYDEKPVDIKDRVKVVMWSLDMASKEGYPHFMLKEIHEQPIALRNTLAGIKIDEIDRICKVLKKVNRIFITGAGTSYHAGLVGDYLFTELCELDVHTFIASEYRKYTRIANENDVLIAISQSGETIDTLVAVREFKKKGCKIIAISNVVESSIPRESNYVIYTRAGPEIGVAATKTFTTQILVLTILAFRYALMNNLITRDEYSSVIQLLNRLPDITHKILEIHEGKCEKLGKEIARKTNAYYLSRGLGVPIAMEGALKLKEIAYIHAEAYPAGESKHGPIALVEHGYPTLFVILDDYYAEIILGNVMEMKSRDAFTIALLPEKYLDKFNKYLDVYFVMPNIDYRLTPIPYIIPLQLIAYYASVSKGLDPDKPRNLAKTVTVE